MAILKPVRKAVLPAAGFGTRFLPVTKAVPKELLPAHVREIQDQDFIWEVTPVEDDGDSLTGDAIDAQ